MPVVTSRVLENGNVAAPDSPDAKKKVAATLMIELGEGSGDCGTGVAHMPRRLAHLLHPCVGIAILVSGLHCNDDGIDGNDGSGWAGVAILCEAFVLLRAAMPGLPSGKWSLARQGLAPKPFKNANLRKILNLTVWMSKHAMLKHTHVPWPC